MYDEIIHLFGGYKDALIDIIGLYSATRSTRIKTKLVFYFDDRFRGFMHREHILHEQSHDSFNCSYQISSFILFRLIISATIVQKLFRIKSAYY